MVEYEKLLSRELERTSMYQLRGLVTTANPDSSLDSNTTNSGPLDKTDNRIDENPEKRQAQLDTIIKSGLHRIEERKTTYTIAGHEFVLQNQIAQAAGLVLQMKDFVGGAVAVSPPASLAWAGVCLILPILTNPYAAEEANTDGFTYVTSHIRFYVALEPLLFPKDANIPKEAKETFQSDITKLYQQILEFQFKSVLRFYRRWLAKIIVDTARGENWEGMLTEIKKTKKVMDEHYNLMNTSASRIALEKLNKDAEESLKSMRSLLSVAERQLEVTTELRDTSSKSLGVLRKIAQHISDPQTQSYLNNLRTTDPRDDKKRIEKTKGGLLAKSYSWVLDNDGFKHWRNDEQSRLLWIRGDPGKGKTMLLCGIIDELSLATRSREKEATTLLSYFFCQASDARINNATAVLRGLIYLLAKQQPSLTSHIRDRYDEGKPFEGKAAWWTLLNIFDSIIQDPSLQNTYLIVDALDECVTDLPLLLSFIVEKSSASPRVKWIVSSRNWPDIEERLGTVIQTTTLRLELNDKSISAAVRTYVKQKVNELATTKSYDKNTRDAVEHSLSLNANNTFLWVALVCQELDKIPRRDSPLPKLKTFPPELDSFYQRMMEQTRDSNKAQLCRSILAIVSIVYQPITLQELASFIDMPGISDNHESLADILELCGSFLTLRDSTVYFIHQSAKDFLLKKAVDEIFPFGIKTMHYSIFSRSLQVMTGKLRRNIYGLQYSGFPVDHIERPKQDPLASVRYSCVYWADHLRDCDPSRSSSWHVLILRYMREWKARSPASLDTNIYIHPSSLGKWCYLALSRFWIYLLFSIRLINVL